MHLWWEANWKWVLTVPSSLMAIILVSALIPDVGCRKDKYSSERWNRAAAESSETTEGAPSHDSSESEGGELP
jgi:cytochrome c oxidase subunit 4